MRVEIAGKKGAALLLDRYLTLVRYIMNYLR